MVLSSSATSSSSTSPTTGLSAIQFSGVSSGLDTAGIIDALMQAEQAPMTRLTTQVSDLTSRQAALTDVRSAWTDLLTNMRNFTENKVGATTAATSSDTAAFSSTATGSAVPGTHSIHVDALATQTIATSTSAIGTAVTDGSKALSSLPLRGTVTAGSIGMVVDGKVVKLDVTDPTTITLDQLGTAMASAMTTQVAGDTGAGFAYSIVNNRLQFSLSGGSSSHTVAFGVAGDTSNALGILGMSTAGGTVSAGGNLSSTSLLGVVQANATLGTAFGGLAGTSGTMTVNGVDFAWNASTDTLTGLMSRINASSAGVIASIDRTNDRVILTSKTAGATALDIRDTGGLAAALNLAPGTTGAQALGKNALVTVDGKQYTSVTNQVTNAIDGVTLNLTAQSAATSSVTVAADQTTLTTALQSLVTSYNNVLDTISKYTDNTPGSTTQGILATDSTVSGLLSQVRSALFTATGGTPPYNNLSAIGLNTGAVGSKNTDGHLALDTTKFSAALTANPAAIAQLLDSSTGALKPMIDRINSYAGLGGVYYQETQGISQQLSSLANEKASLQETLDAKRSALETKYAAMESTLSGLQTTLKSLSAQSTTTTG